MTDPVILNERVLHLVEAELAGLDDFDTVNKIAELIEVFSREMPQMLAELRVEKVRALDGRYTPDEIHKGTGISPSRLRKLLDR